MVAATATKSHRVRREDLISPATSQRSSPDSELLNLFQQRVKSDFTFIDSIPDSARGNAAREEQDDNDDDGAVSFRLFASAPSAKQAHAVRLRSPSREHREPGLVQPHRPRGYYFADVDDATFSASVNSAAIDGKQVIARSKTACQGCRLPWRVTFISPSQDRGSRVTAATASAAKATPLSSGLVGSSKKTAKPGKKHRIALHVKQASAKAALQAQQRTAADKEAADREKRTRRNREKKVKRKEKEKAKKAATADPD